MPDYTKPDAWDGRYRSSGPQASGTFDHTNAGNDLFYRAKYDAVDRCLRAIKKTLTGTRVLDAAAGPGKFIPYFVERGCSHITVGDFSEVALRLVRAQYQSDSRVDAVLLDLAEYAPALAYSYDFAFVMEAVALLPSDESLRQSLLNLGRYVVPGGYLIISGVFPASPIKNSYVTHRTRSMVEEYMAAANLRVLGSVLQTVLFNRRIFGPLQPYIEHAGTLYYWLDHIARTCGAKPPSATYCECLIAQRRMA